MWYENIDEREIKPQLASEVSMVSEFLAQFGMALNARAEYTIALYCQERIIATGSLAGENLCSIAVDPEFRGEGLAAKVISNLIREGRLRGRYLYLINVDLETADLFSSLGFSKIARVESSGVLMAMGLNIGKK